MSETTPPSRHEREDPLDPAFIHADGSTWVAVSWDEFERACDELAESARLRDE